MATVREFPVTGFCCQERIDSMFHRPRFKPHFLVEVVPGEGVFLLTEQHQTVLQGRLYELVAAHLDGRTVEEIGGQLRGQASLAEIHYTLSRLEQKGYLTEHKEILPVGEAAFWSIQGIEPALAARRLAETPVAVRTVADLDIGPFRELLRSLHVDVQEEGQLTVVLTDGYLRSGLREHNRQALETGRPWLLVKPVGCQVWVGPLFRPGESGCWECLAERIRSNSPVAGFLDAKRGSSDFSPIDRAQTPATLQIAWGLAAQAVVSWIVRGDLPQLSGKIQTLSVLTGQSETHALIRQPFCPACGVPSNSHDRPVAPLVLQSCRKVFTQDGGHRALSPEQTLERYRHHVSAITGAVSMLERDECGDDNVVHCYLSGHNTARGPRTFRTMRRDLRSSSSGKGTTAVQAKVSALCEGLERYSAVFRGDEPRRRARFLDLPDAIHPSTCLHFSEKQYEGRDAWNAQGPRYNLIPRPFDPQAEIDWTPVWSLTQQKARYLPTSFCYFDYPDAPEQTFCWSNSNGNAAGNTQEEAILQGFLELVERDSVALWWYNRVRRPGVDLDSFVDPYLAELQEFLHRHHRNLWALDLTSDLEVPVFAAVTRRTDGPTEDIVFGFGAHLDARLALLRAVTEMNQMLVQVLDSPVGAQVTDKDTLDWLRTGTLANQPYVAPLDVPPRTADSYSPSRSDDLKDDVLACQALVERHGMEMLALDQTRPEIGLPVVKVIVPGLRHFWPRFAPGRLYDVPVRMGWLARPLLEGQFNPIPMFL